MNLTEESAARDLDLLKRWRSGEREAGATLMGFYTHGVHRMCRRFGIVDQDGQVEIFQEAVLATLRELPRLPETITKSFSGWFSWQVRHAISRRVQSGRTGVPLPEISVDGLSSEARLALREAIKACWERLPAMEHRVFELRFLKGLSLKEAAEVVGGNANAIGQTIFRLSRRMRACLGDSGFDEGTS